MSIFNYQSPRQFLLDTLAARQKEQPGFSVRAWAREMELPSHTLLVMLLQGKRPLRVKHAAFLSKGAKLSSQERLYLQALIQFDSAEDPEEKQLCSVWLSDLHPDRKVSIREVEEFHVLSDWLHMAVLASTELRESVSSAEEIHSKFRTRATIHEVRSAIERLQSLGLLTRDAEGRFSATYQRVTTRDDVANRGARKYHRNVSELAGRAVEELPLERREFQAFSVAIPDEKLSLAKDLIRKFRTQFAKAMGSENGGDQVYQINLQLFQLTESPGPRPEDEGADAAILME